MGMPQMGANTPALTPDNRQQGPIAPTVPATDGGAGTNLGGQPAQPNIFNQSAQAYTDALSTTRQALGMMPTTVTAQQGQAQGYNPATGQAALAQGIGYNLSLIHI